MTANKEFKRRVRARATRTGESYQAARHQLLAHAKEPEQMPKTNTADRRLRIAINALPVGPGLPTEAPLVAQATRIVSAMEASAAGGARVALFTEGALASPHKRSMSGAAPEVAEADWTKLDWAALRAQLSRVADAARAHGVWTVVGAVHDLGRDRRPHNCLYVISDEGVLETRYDKRRLSTTEVTYMYTPGTEPVAFDLDGFRIGLLIGLEVLFPDYFTAYADGGADLIVAASHGGGIFEQLVTSYSLVNQVPIALVIPPLDGDPSRPGVYGPGAVAETATEADAPAPLFADITKRDPSSLFHYKARHGFYDERLPHDEPRHRIRNRF